MAEPSTIWVDWIIKQYGIVPVWTEDDVQAVIKKAVDISTDHAKSELLKANGNFILSLLADAQSRGPQALYVMMRDLGMSYVRDSNILAEQVAQKVGYVPNDESK